MQLDKSLPECQKAQTVLAAVHNDMRASCQSDKTSQAGRITKIESTVAQVPSLRRCTIIKRAIDVEQFKINSNFITVKRHNPSHIKRSQSRWWRMQQWRHIDQVKHVEIACSASKCGLSGRLLDDPRDKCGGTRTISITTAVSRGNSQRTQGVE